MLKWFVFLILICLFFGQLNCGSRVKTDLEVWQVLQAVRHVLLIHKTYPPARLNACNHVMIDRVTGKNVPASFFEEFGTDPSTTDQAETTDVNNTETLFRSIIT